MNKIQVLLDEEEVRKLTAIIVITLVLYLLTVIWARYEFNKFNSVEVQPTISNVFLVLIPFFNLATALILADENGRFDKFAKKFFGK